MADNLVKLGEIIKFSRLSVCYENNIIESVLTHEMGHLIYGQLFKDSNKTAVVKQVYEKSIKNGDIYEISKYAKKDEVDFFAEAFCIYKIGREKLPEPIEKMIEQCLARGGTK